MEFKNKVVLVTGGGSGIGRETAYLYATQGAKVVIADINEKGSKETVQTIKDNGGVAFFIKTNVADADQVKSLIDTIVVKYGQLDIAINNAGIGGSMARTHEASLEDWDKVMAVNTSGVFYCMKYELQQMLKQEGGAIINIASIAGLKGLPNSVAYTASKHAVVGMTKTVAVEYARKNIRVNAVCPVFTKTALFQPEVFDQFKPGISDKLKGGIPMKRFGKVNETAQAILWLTSSASSFITGHALPVDGGLMA